MGVRNETAEPVVNVTVTVPLSLRDRLDAIGKRTMRSRSWLAKQAITTYVTAMEDQQKREGTR